MCRWHSASQAASTSNALIAIAKRVLGYDVHGFTIVNEDARYDERDMVRCAVDDMQLRHTAVPIDRVGFLDKLRTLVRQHDAPVYTISYYLQWQLMRQVAAQGYKVSISGTGADELFSGYYDHQNFYLAEVRADQARYAEALTDWRANIAPIVRNPYLQDPDVFVENPQERRHIFLDADEFAGYLTHSWSEPFAEAHYADSPLRNRMLNELFHEAVPPILHEDDLNAMYYSVENRSPYLDRALFEETMRIPTRHLVRRGRAKALLRDAVKDIVPNAVIDNPRKVGFNAPILDLLDTSNSEVRAALLDNSPVFDYVHRDRIEALIGPLASAQQRKQIFILLPQCQVVYRGIRELERDAMIENGLGNLASVAGAVERLDFEPLTLHGCYAGHRSSPSIGTLASATVLAHASGEWIDRRNR